MLAETLDPSRDTVAAPFADALLEAGRRHEDVVVLSADLAKWTDVRPFAGQFPDRFVQVGMAEQNAVGIAGGLAKAGWRPVVVGFGAFLSRRAYDQVAMSLATGPNAVVLVGFLPGVMSRFRGTHQAVEDLALLRAVPGARVLDPADSLELSQALHSALARGGLTYLRANRGQVPRLFEGPPTGDLPDVRRVADGAGRVGVVSTGLATAWSVAAAEHLPGAVPHLHVASLKPFPDEAVAAFCAALDVVLTVENHVAHAGLGSAVAMAVADRGLGTRVTRLGLSDDWQAYGTPDYVRGQAGLDPRHIAAAVRAAQVGSSSPGAPPGLVA